MTILSKVILLTDGPKMANYGLLTKSSIARKGMKLEGTRTNDRKLAHRFFSLPMFLRVAWVWILAGLILSLASFFVPSYPAAVLCFYFFFSWILWIGCAWIDVSRRKLVSIFYQWLAIDFSILICFLSVANSIGDVDSSQGSEIIWGIAYLPSILPFGLIVNTLPDSTSMLAEELMKICAKTLGSAFGHVVGTWIVLSFISLLQCGIIAGIIFCLRPWMRIFLFNSEEVG